MDNTYSVGSEDWRAIFGHQGEKPKDRLLMIFMRQAELMKKYEKIEGDNGFHWLIGRIPVDLHDKFAQARIKDCAWRVIEELAEMLDSMMCHPSKEHHKEELVDALHFLVELCITVGLTPEEILTRPLRPVGWDEDMLDKIFAIQYPYIRDSLDISPVLYTHLCCAKFMRNLGYSCNYLKNRPWKSSHRMTDEDKFLDQLSLAFTTFFSIPIALGVTPEEMFNLYFRKAQINQERQEGNY